MTSTQVHVLIVEDDPSTREVERRFLHAQGFIVHTVSSVGEALLALESQSFDAVLLDLRLPDADGTLLLRRIRRDRMPIRVAVVAGMELSLYPDLQRYQPGAIFKKPVDMSRLICWLNDDEHPNQGSAGS